MTTYWDEHTIAAHDRAFADAHPDWERQHRSHLTADDLRAAEEALALVGDRLPENDPQVCTVLRALRLASACGHPDEDHPLCCAGCPTGHEPTCSESWHCAWCGAAVSSLPCPNCGAGTNRSAASPVEGTATPEVPR
ncbi:MAG TPA: hypothetical protein VGL02_32180 [Streptomyces sp.]